MLGVKSKLTFYSMTFLYLLNFLSSARVVHPLYAHLKRKKVGKVPVQGQGIKPSFSAWEALGHHPLSVFFCPVNHLLGTGFILIAHLLVLV